MAYVRTRLGRWFYEERGIARSEGDPCIVLLHGLFFDGGMWNACVGPLAELGRVLVIDGPGHGKSEASPPFMLEDHAEALADALRELGIARAVVVGLSWGGMVAMRLALAHPELVAAMALLDTSAENEGFFETLPYRAMTELASRWGLPLSLARAKICPLLFGPKILRERPAIVREWTRRVNGYPRKGLVHAIYAVSIRRKSVLSKLGAVRAPTLVVCGKDDAATPLRRSQAIAGAIAGARLVTIEDSGHMSPIEQPDAVNASLVPFVRGEVQGAAAA